MSTSTPAGLPQNYTFEFYCPTTLQFNADQTTDAPEPPTPEPAPPPITFTLLSDEAADEWLQPNLMVVIGRGGRPKVYNYTEFHKCARAGKYVQQLSANIVPQKRRQHHTHGSVFTECPAQIILRQRVGRTEVEIEHHDNHNHEIGTLEAMAEEMLSKRQKRWIADKVAEGLDWAAFKRLIRLDSSMLTAISSRATTTIPDTLAIEYMDVYNAIRRSLTTAAVRDRDGMKSLDLWAEQLRADGYSVLFQQVSVRAEGESSYVFAFVSPWQKQLLRDYPEISCLDSTHNTCFSATGKDEKAFLYTLVLKNRVTGKGVPAGFMISPGESQWPVYDWLKWLRKPVADGGLGYTGKRWMIDCSDAEAAAIRNAIPGAEIIVCMWHVYKAVADQAKKKLHATVQDQREKVTENKKLRDGALNDFRELARCGTPEQFTALWHSHMNKYANHAHWRTYLESEWLPKRKQWVWAYRKDIVQYGIETNNYVESWHSHLKTFYLKLMRRQRVDVLVYILTSQVLLDFQREETRIQCGLARPALTSHERHSRELAYAVPSTELEHMVRLDVEGDENTTPNFLVNAFTRDPDTWYRVTICELPARTPAGQPRPVIAECACPIFTRKKLPCKHMFLASRTSTYPVEPAADLLARPTSAIPIPPAIQPEPLVQPLASFATSASLGQFQISPETTVAPAHLAKQATLTRTVAELEKITQLTARLATMTVEDIPHELMIRLETQATGMRRELSDVVQQRPLHARQRA